mmetsp:Transcript_25439/g.57775  ORF Transcript_25439/g.57775 Transcript_25439/m.57775 type:complete len:86 (+) Transcript_25439:110-367(+)
MMAPCSWGIYWPGDTCWQWQRGQWVPDNLKRHGAIIEQLNSFDVGGKPRHVMLEMMRDFHDGTMQLGHLLARRYLLAMAAGPVGS